MKTSCIISIFAFFAVSIGMHAQTQKTLFFGDPNDPDESYSGYTINLSGSGALASFLRSASSDVKSADYIEITGATLNEDDVEALAQLNAKFIDLDACTFTDNSLASSITASSNIEAMSLPAGLTKEQVNAAGAKLAGINSDFGSVASIIGTNEVACYAHTPGTLYEANTLAEAKESLKWVISGNITLEDLCGGVSGHTDPGSTSITGDDRFSKTVDDSHYAWGSNSPTSIDLSGVTTIKDYKYLRILKKYNGSVEELSFSPKIPTIPQECCQWYTQLKSVVIPEGVKTIEEHAFLGCPLLEYVHIPRSIDCVKTEAFKDCTKLYYLDFAQGIETLNFQENVFNGCTGLKHISLPEGLKTIGDNTFLNCTALQSVRLPSTLQTIGNNAFKGCISLLSIIIPENVETIGQSAFPQQLKDVYLMAKDIAHLPKIWTAGAEGAAQSVSVKESTFGAATLINENSDNASGPDALSGMTWVQACQDYYLGIPYLDPETGSNIGAGMAALHYPADFKADEIESAFKLSISAHYGYETFDRVKVPSNNHGYINGTDYWNYIPDRNQNNDYGRRICAAEPDNNEDIKKTFLSKTGWRQFALIKANSTDNELEKKYKEVWYTMCFPFNLDDEQLTEAFGAGFNICEFSGVTAEEIDGKKTIILHFTSKVTEIIPDGETTGYLAEAFHPYMIHPNYKAEDKTMEYTALFRGFKTIKVDTEESEGTNKPSAHSVTKTVTDKNGNEILFDGKNGKYTFIGNVEEVDGKGKKIPYGAYFLGTAKGQTYPKFWRETKTENTAWSQYAAIVIADEAFERKYFEIQEGEAWVKGFDFVMDGFESPDGEALSIENIVEDAKTKNLPVQYMNIVYDMDGQMIRKGDAELGDLPSGMYIVNGKKYLVK